MLAVMAIMTLTASAQVEQGFRNGIRVNLGLSNVIYDGDKMTFGYGAAWVAEYNFNPSLYLQSGLGLENIAHKEDAIDGTLNAFYLQLPIHVGYRFDLGETTALFVQAGPTLSVGLFGSDIEWYGGGKSNYFDHAKRFDLGVGGRVGVEVSKFQIGVGANYGVLKVMDIGGHNLSANINLAYMF